MTKKSTTTAEVKSLRAKLKRAIGRATHFEAKYDFAIDEYATLATAMEHQSAKVDRIESEHHTVLRMCQTILLYNEKLEKEIVSLREAQDARLREDEPPLLTMKKTHGDN